MTELDLSYYLNDDILHLAENDVPDLKLPDYHNAASHGSGSVLHKKTFKILESERKDFTKVSENFDGRVDNITVEKLSTLNITEPHSSLVNGFLDQAEKQAVVPELSDIGGEKLGLVLSVVDELESDNESLFLSHNDQKTCHHFLKDAADLKIYNSQFQQEPFISLLGSNNELFRESTFHAEDSSSHSDNDKLFNPVLSSFNLPKYGSEAHEDGKCSGFEDSSGETECASARLNIDLLPINRGVKLIMSGSSVEQKLLTKATDKDANFENAEERVSESSFRLRKEEEDKIRAERRIKEATIQHNDFAPLEEGMLFQLFYLPSTKSRKGSSTRRKRRSRKNGVKPEGKTNIGQELLVSLYMKDTVISYQTERTEQEKMAQADINLKNPEEWLCALNSAFEIDDDILDEIDFDQGGISAPLTAFENVSDVLLSNELIATDSARPHATMAVSLESTRGIDISQKFSGRTFDPPAAPNSAISLISSRINEKQDPETVIDVIMSSPEAEVAMSPPGTVTAFLYSKDDPDGKKNRLNQSLFYEGIQSMLKKDDRVLKGIGSRVVNEGLDNHFVYPPAKENRKRQRSFRKMLFAKSPLLRKTDHFEKYDRKPSNVEIEDFQGDRKSGTIISLRSLWRSRSASYSTSHSTSLSRFNLESGESLNDYVADYVGSRDLKLPRYGDVISKGAEAAKKMMLDGRDPKSESGTDSKESDDSDDTLTSFVVDKLHVGTKSVLEYSPTAAPMVSKLCEIDEDKGWFGLRRFKTMSYMKRHPTIRFAQEPTYITEQAKALNFCAAEHSDGTLEGDSLSQMKSILKRRSTLGAQKKRFRSLFSVKV